MRLYICAMEGLVREMAAMTVQGHIVGQTCMTEFCRCVLLTAFKFTQAGKSPSTCTRADKTSVLQLCVY